MHNIASEALPNTSVPLLMQDADREALVSKVLGFSSADQTEVLLHVNDNALSRFTHESLNQNIGNSDMALSIRAIVDKRTGVVSTNNLDAASLQDAVARAIALAKLAPRNDALPSLPSATVMPPAPGGAFAEATAQADSQKRADICDAVFRVAEANNVWSAGYCATDSSGITVANSHGTLVSYSGTGASLNVKLIAPNSSGFAQYHTSDITTLDARAVAETAARKARETANPKEVEPGEWTVILEPPAFSELIMFLFSHFGAQQFDEGSSFFSGAKETSDGFHLDAGVNGSRGIELSERFTLYDDYAHPLAPSMPFDYEGHSTMRLPLVENGRIRNIVTDSYWAHKLDRANTGHALPAPNSHGPHVRNPVVAPGEKPIEQLIAETKRGLLISRFWYIRTVDPKQAIVTGMTRDGTYLIENGKLAGGVFNMRFNQSTLEALRRCEFSSEQKRTDLHSFVVPAVKIDGFRFTSTTKF